MRLFTVFFITICLLYSATTQADIVLQNLQGEDIALSSLKGKWVYINYWASWCGPCLDEISVLNHFYEKNKSHSVQIYAVNYESLPLNKQQALIKQFNIHYPSLKHNTATRLHLGPINVVPITFVLNPNGELSTTLYGGQTLENLTEAMTTP